MFIESHNMKSYSCFYVVCNMNMSSQHFPSCTLRNMIADVIRVQNNYSQRKYISPTSFDYYIKLKSRVYLSVLNGHLTTAPCFPWEKKSQFLLYTLWSNKVSFFNNLFSGLRKQIAKLYIIQYLLEAYQSPWSKWRTSRCLPHTLPGLLFFKNPTPAVYHTKLMATGWNPNRVVDHDTSSVSQVAASLKVPQASFLKHALNAAFCFFDFINLNWAPHAGGGHLCSLP